ncbi:MAG TPA: Gfo/Idh/MocA family oxidoreductase [Myxococcota bacterium]
MKDQAIVRYAVVGAGHIAQHAVLPAFAHADENSQLCAIISSDAKKRDVLGETYGAAVGDYDELERIFAEGDIDAAYLAVPNTQHRELAERCAAAGVHVLCEKPLAMSAADCEAMIDACTAGGVKLMCAYRLHFDEATLRAIALAHSGAIGEPRYVSSVFSQDVAPGNIRTQPGSGGGALYDLGVYCVNAARCLFGAEPILVYGTMSYGADERFSEVEEMAAATMRFADGQIAQFICNQGTAGVDELHVVGTKGQVTLEPAFDYQKPLTMNAMVGGNEDETTFEVHDQFAPELVYFSRCILEDLEPEPSGDEGLGDVRVLEAIVESARTGMPVDLAPFDKRSRPTLDLAMHKPKPIEAKLVDASPPGR